MMKNNSGVLIGFIVGAVVGSAVTWWHTRRKYADIAEKEIYSVKETYARGKDESISHQTQETVNKVTEKSSIGEYVKQIQKEGYVDYSRTIEDQSSVPANKPPYVISPEEFGEIEEYAKASLTCFSDGVLADEYGEVIENVAEIVGDALEHFGEYEDDSVFVRSDTKRCDYEILQDLREFDEFLETLPPNH